MSAPDSPPPLPAQPGDEFVALLVRNQRQIYAFIGTLLPQQVELDDLFQQTCLLLWQKRDQFDPARPFLPWASARGGLRSAGRSKQTDPTRSRIHLSARRG
jgi:RNA polymerase sigma factor (sigma-70 family)